MKVCRDPVEKWHWSKPSNALVRELLYKFQTLLTSETASIKDEDGRTVLLTAAEMGELFLLLCLSPCF